MNVPSISVIKCDIYCIVLVGKIFHNNATIFGLLNIIKLHPKTKDGVYGAVVLSEACAGNFQLFASKEKLLKLNFVANKGRVIRMLSHSMEH